jgi:hypothetical protein
MAHVNILKAQPKIFPFHPEKAIDSNIAAFALGFCILVLVPKGRRIRPIACPLKLSPRVAQAKRQKPSASITDYTV